MKRLMQRAGAFLFIPALCGTAATLSTSAAEAAEGRARVLVLDIELVDTSHEGEHPAHADRLDMVSRHLRALLDEPGTLEILGPVGGGERIRACNGCEVEIARKAGADFVLTGYVHKVSTLILSVTLTVKDVATAVSSRAAAPTSVVTMTGRGFAASGGWSSTGSSPPTVREFVSRAHGRTMTPHGAPPTATLLMTRSSSRSITDMSLLTPLVV